MKKRSEVMQTLCTGYSKADPQRNTNKHTDRGRLQYTAQLSVQCNEVVK